MLRHQELVTVAHFLNAFEAHLAAGLLENEGIPAIVSDDSTCLSQMRPLFAKHAGVGVRVRAEDAEKARRVLSETGNVDDECFLEAGEEVAKMEDAANALVCPLCASPGLQHRRRWWLLPVILLPLALLPVKPVAAVSFSVALLAGSLLLPQKYVCSKCRNAVTAKR